MTGPARSVPADGKCQCAANRGLAEWSTTAELCAWLGIEVTALYWLRSTGQGPRGHKVGKETRYRARDVEQWLATRAEP
jgi:predicted DNA-binding transcriptional regulator AlpA